MRPVHVVSPAAGWQRWLTPAIALLALLNVSAVGISWSTTNRKGNHLDAALRMLATSHDCTNLEQALGVVDRTATACLLALSVEAGSEHETAAYAKMRLQRLTELLREAEQRDSGNQVGPRPADPR